MMDSEINITNLDNAYDQCYNLNEVAKTGEKIIENLALNINNLKTHWIDSAATAHINNLIKIYQDLCMIVTDAKKVTWAIGEHVIKMQSVVASLGGAVSTGTSLDGSVPNVIENFNNVEETKAFQVSASLETDYNDLDSITKTFTTFKDSFTSAKDELLTNWTSGANRETVVTNFNNFETNEATHESNLKSAVEALATAVSRIKSI